MMQDTLSRRAERNALLAALFCTAFSSLAYELVWCRQLSYVFGSTALATSTVLAVFMCGLAVGNLCAGRILESRSRPYMFLAALQFAIGFACILTLFAIKGIHGYGGYFTATGSANLVYAFRIILFLLTCGILVVSTFLIGVAFPCIVQLYHARHQLVGETVSRCYWIDTLGACLGMLAAALTLVPTIGFFRTSVAASAVNVLAGVIVLWFFRKSAPARSELATGPVLQAADSQDHIDIKVVSFLFFLSGFAALVLEVIWVRHWELIYGSGLHAFAVVVVTFLLGLSVGSLLYELFLKGIGNQVLLFSAVELCIGASAIVVTAIFPHIEGLFLRIYYAAKSYNLFLASMSLVCFSLLLVPTTLMGITLPALCAVNVSGRCIGRDFGRLYAVNSFGALAGSLLAGFIIIPALGIHQSPFLAAGIYVFVSLAFLYCFCGSGNTRRRATAAFAVIVVLAGTACAALRKPNHFYTGVFYTGTLGDEEDYKGFIEQQNMALRFARYVKNGVYGQVTVTGQANALILRTNGRIDSGTSVDLVSYQSLLGHIPMIIHNKPSNVLNIGLGCGWTVRAAAMHPVLESVDCVELNPLVVEVNKNVLHSYNGDVVHNPKVNVIVDDGRNYVAYTGKKYDVVVSEPTDLSSSGISALFTREFYRSVCNVLNENGILCQWFPRYEVTEESYKIILKTIKSIFPYAYEFKMPTTVPSDYYQSVLIMASKKPVDVGMVLRQRKTLCENEPSEYHSWLLQLISLVERSFAGDNEALETYIAGVDKLNTDDFPLIEFQALKTRFKRFKKG